MCAHVWLGLCVYLGYDGYNDRVCEEESLSVTREMGVVGGGFPRGVVCAGVCLGPAELVRENFVLSADTFG